MKRAKQEEGFNSMDRLSELPKEILQRILYLLSQKEAVRTSVLSKSWRYIWCTRPNLDFLEAAFKGNMPQFLSVVNSTLKQYRDRSLCVDEFRICISVGDLDHRSVYLLRKWIRILKNMRVKKFCLCTRSDNRKGLAKLPSIVFGAESLQVLHLEGFVLNRKTIKRIVLFKHLTSLSLQRVSVEDKVLKKILSCCPSIETLNVEVCTRLSIINVIDLHNLKAFSFSDLNYDTDLYLADEFCGIEIRTPSIETIYINEGNIWFHKGEDYRNLKDLSLVDVKSSLEHLSSCKFPSLEHLRLSDCVGLKEIELFIDAPNIKYFDYDGDFIPSISFATTFNEWKSNLYLTYGHRDEASSWFIKLQELLKALSQSQISLGLDGDSTDLVQEINVGNKPASVVVESLHFDCHSSLISSLLNGAFSICRPRNIEDCLCGDKGERKRIARLWKILMRREIGEGDEFSQSWFRDLEEVRMEIDDDNRNEWRPISLSELPHYPENNQKELYAVSSWDSHNDHENWYPLNLSELENNETRSEFIGTRFRLKWRDLAG